VCSLHNVTANVWDEYMSVWGWQLRFPFVDVGAGPDLRHFPLLALNV
jgi:hypothetical protein